MPNYPSYASPIVLPSYEPPKMDLSNLLKVMAYSGQKAKAAKTTAKEEKLPDIKGTTGEVRQWQRMYDQYKRDINTSRSMYGPDSFNLLAQDPVYQRGSSGLNKIMSPGNIYEMERNEGIVDKYSEHIKDIGNLWDLESRERGLGTFNYGRRLQGMEMAPEFTDFAGFNFKHSTWGEVDVQDFYKDKWANLGKDQAKYNASEVSKLTIETLGGRRGVVRNVTAQNRTGKSDNIEQVASRMKTFGVDENVLHGLEQGFISYAMGQKGDDNYYKLLDKNGKTTQQYYDKMNVWTKNKLIDWANSARERITDTDYANSGQMSWNELNDKTKELADQEFAVMMDSGFKQPTNWFETTSDNYEAANLSQDFYNDKGYGVEYIDDFMIFMQQYGKDANGNWGTVEELGNKLMEGGVSIPRQDAGDTLGALVYDYTEEGAKLRAAYNAFRIKNNKGIVPLMGEEGIVIQMKDPNVMTVPLSGQSNYREVMKNKYGPEVFEGTVDAHNFTLGAHDGGMWRNLQDTPPLTKIKFGELINLNVGGPVVTSKGDFIWNQPSSTLETNRRRREVQKRIAANEITPDPGLPQYLITHGAVLTVKGTKYMPYDDNANVNYTNDYWKGQNFSFPVEVKAPTVSDADLPKLKSISDADVAAFAMENDTGLLWTRKTTVRPAGHKDSSGFIEEVYYIDNKNTRKWTPDEIRSIILTNKENEKKWTVHHIKNSRELRSMDHNTGDKGIIDGVDKDGKKHSVKVPLSDYTIKALNLSLEKDVGGYGGWSIVQPINISINDMLDPSIEAQMQLRIQMNSMEAKEQKKALEVIKGKMYQGVNK